MSSRTSIVWNWSFLLLLAVALPLSAQSGSSQLSQKIQDSFEKSFNQSSSYTMKGTRSTKMEIGKKNIPPVTQKMDLTTKFEDPYLYQDGVMEMEAMTGTQKSPMKTIGKIGPNEDFFLQMKGQQGWKNLTQASQQKMKMNFQKMIKELKNPKKLMKVIKNPQSSGEETIDGEPCEKITGSIDKKAMQKEMKGQMEQMLNAAQGKANFDTSTSIESGGVAFWISKKDNRIRQTEMKSKMDLKINISTPSRQKAMSRNWSISQEQKMKYTDYNNTKVDQKMKDKYKELQSK